MQRMGKREEILSWIDTVEAEQGWRDNEFATKAGIASTTITRLRKNPEAPLMSTRTLAKLEKVAGKEFKPSAKGLARAVNMDKVELALELELERVLEERVDLRIREHKEAFVRNVLRVYKKLAEG